MTTDIFCYSTGMAGRDPNSADGPLHLIKSWQQTDPAITVLDNITATGEGHGLDALPYIHDMCNKLAQSIFQSVTQNRYFLSITGDHSSAIGTWSGAFAACHQQGKTPGLIWIDAHMDAHTPEDSDTQNIHGMPLAALLGEGPTELTTLIHDNTKVAPEHVTLIGIRSFEPSEEKRLNDMNVKIYYIDEVKKRGLQAVLQETITHLNKKVDSLGLTIDIDAIDPTEAPGVSTPEANGLCAQELIDSLPLIANQPHLIGCEVTEFLPSKDHNRNTEKITLDILKAVYR